jgi:hypothetical protein
MGEIYVEFSDPFDNALLATCSLPYDPRKVTCGFSYARHIKKLRRALKSIQSCILEGREPNMKVKLRK